MARVNSTTTPWTVTPEIAEYLRGRKCEECTGTGVFSPTVVQADGWPCNACHGHGVIRPECVVAPAEVERDCIGVEWIEGKWWSKHDDGDGVWMNIIDCPFGPVGGVCEVVLANQTGRDYRKPVGSFRVATIEVVKFGTVSAPWVHAFPDLFVDDFVWTSPAEWLK